MNYGFVRKKGIPPSKRYNLHFFKLCAYERIRYLVDLLFGVIQVKGIYIIMYRGLSQSDLCVYKIELSINPI